MKEPVVLDSTCLISLERIGFIGILPALFKPILIPPAVEQEYGSAQPWLGVEVPKDEALVNALGLVVDAGEAEAIALASERKVKIVIDDKQARVVAKRVGVQVIGTMGCLLKAKRAGVIGAIKPLIEKLEDEGFYLSEVLKAEALRLAGE